MTTASEVVCVGEALIDLVATEPGTAVGDAPAFVKAPGGAPANLAVGLARLGIATAFLGRVGDDAFGHYLARTLAAEGVAVDHLWFDRRARTALAFVALDHDRKPDYLFYRHPSADQLLTAEDVRRAAGAAPVLCAGSVLSSAEPSAGALVAALREAREAGRLVAFDVNLRPDLFGSDQAMVDAVREVLPLVHVAKCNAEELAVLTGVADPRDAIRALSALGPGLVVVTHGPAGAEAAAGGRAVRADGFRSNVVDTTGAGDAFMAALVAGLVRFGVRPADVPAVPSDVLQAMLIGANAAGALATAAIGGIPSLPTAAALRDFLRRAGHEAAAEWVLQHEAR